MPGQGAPQQPQAHQQPRVSGPTGLVGMPGNNPLLTAAGPLLDLLGRLRNGMTQAGLSQLWEPIKRHVDGFDAAANAAGAYQQQLHDAKYALCAVADDIVLNLPGTDRQVWNDQPMLVTFFNERLGGVKFYQLVDAALRNPGANYDLLELYYACLALGFEGEHRASPTGQAAVLACRNEIYQALRGVNRGGGWLISPNWKGMDIGKRSVGMQIPFWAVAALVALLMTGAYFGLRFLISGEASALSSEVANLHPATPPQIVSPDRPKTAGTGTVVIAGAGDKEEGNLVIAAPDPGQLDRIRATLKNEIDAGLVEARYLDANFIIVRFSNELLFPSGSADVSDSFRSGLAKRMGETFYKEAEILKAKQQDLGRVYAIGHSDAQRLSVNSRWSSNHELSEARAKSVMDAIAQFSPPKCGPRFADAVQTIRRASRPTTRAAGPRNRRVELLIERTQ